MKTEYDAARLIYNRFKSAIAYKPTIATVLSPDVRGPLFRLLILEPQCSFTSPAHAQCPGYLADSW